MFALTLTQPWASMVALGVKLVENRTWRPPAKMLRGLPFAIHASRECDLDTCHDLFIAKIFGPDIVSPYQKPKDYPRGAVIGIATIDRAIASSPPLGPEFGEVASLPEDQRRWLFGPIGFVLRDVRALAVPIPCKGALGFWDLGAAAVVAIDTQLAAAETTNSPWPAHRAACTHCTRTPESPCSFGARYARTP